MSYNEKHNEANGEENRDGSNDNFSWNHGVEGPTADPAIIELREREKRNLLLTLLFSQGVPMLCAGDEMGHTQLGNNNAYCQDNELSWLSWELDQRDQDLLAFTACLIELRRNHPNLRRRKFFQDRQISPTKSSTQKVDDLEVQDITWFRPDGHEMTEDEWQAGWVRCLGLRLSGRTLNDVTQEGESLKDDTYLICLNPHHENIAFFLPDCTKACTWEVLVDTRDPSPVEARMIHNDKPYDLTSNSAVVLRESVAKTALQHFAEIPTTVLEVVK